MDLNQSQAEELSGYERSINITGKITNIILESRVNTRDLPTPPTLDTTLHVQTTTHQEIVKEYSDLVTNFRCDKHFCVSLEIFATRMEGEKKEDTLIENWAFTFKNTCDSPQIKSLECEEIKQLVRSVYTVTRLLPAFAYSKHLLKRTNEFSVTYKLSVEHNSIEKPKSRQAIFKDADPSSYIFPTVYTQEGSMSVQVLYTSNHSSLSKPVELKMFQYIDQSYYPGMEPAANQNPILVDSMAPSIVTVPDNNSLETDDGDEEDGLPVFTPIKMRAAPEIFESCQSTLTDSGFVSCLSEPGAPQLSMETIMFEAFLDRVTPLQMFRKMQAKCTLYDLQELEMFGRNTLHIVDL